MDLSGVKLVVSDMDGTLLNGKGKLSNNFPQIFRKLRENNILFAVASGRQYYSLLEKFKVVKDDLIFIAENGAIVMEKEEQKFIQPMAREKVLEVIETTRNIGGKYLILCGRKSAYIERTDPQFMDPFLRHYDKYEVVEDLTLVEDDDFLKVTICDLAGAEKNTFPHVKHFGESLQVKLSGEIWVDFTHKQAQKGNALKKIQDIYGIAPEETVVFGDYFNDLELFENAAFSFAMGNAHEEVKERAKYHTKSNEEEGVELVLEDLLKDLNNARVKPQQ